MIAADLPGAAVRFSTRAGGVSEGPYESLNIGLLTGDEGERVMANRRRLAERAGLAAVRVALGHQVHGAGVRAWQGPPAADAAAFADADVAPPQADAHVTGARDVALLVQVADCLPVALAAPGRVAIAHCGWRGLADGVVANAVAAFDEPPRAVVGPGIGPCCFEVGPEVRARFADVAGAAAGRMLDLRAVAEARLRAAGVEHVEHVDLCTSCREDLFFSHRRDGGVTGRQCGIAWRT